MLLTSEIPPKTVESEMNCGQVNAAFVAIDNQALSLFEKAGTETALVVNN